ncbi:O-antigen ligase domain-containing protein [Leptolyngbya sp. FACHB-261]|uniref:O-antigen ligase domain-containing protein n=1 Tax=Leptolyngbya sp. FACHB-261 TaxID=2692806 RepID=UPI0016851C9A|nr:O-antigen ligase domain-containing protein [Leptolyngbya sp. FACHB-261]MBD2105161.1 O-antigen ligase domain-containing protein [Leptolyngbya sp. FACHB-261]
MDTRNDLSPCNFEERLVWHAITGTYGLYVVGGLYIAAPAIAWILLFYLCRKLWQQTDLTPAADRIYIPWGVWIWVSAMLVMEVALIMGHLDFGLGVPAIIKSTIGWAKGWALMAIFPLIGCLKIRPQLIYRATCIVCFQTLLLFPLFLLAYVLHLPQTPYVSPTSLVGGPGPEFFALNLYEIDPEGGRVRWRLFTPWAPALGFVANVYFVFALQEKVKKWRWAGIIASVLMCVVSQSRLALVTLAVVPIFSRILANLTRPGMLFTLGFTSTLTGIFTPALLQAYHDFLDAFKAARAGSSRVRATLGSIAVQRWQDEAPIWGHGVVERGPHLVEYMPIGSHHSWFGLLFVKGLVGFLALAVPLLLSFVDLLLKAQNSVIAQTGLSILLILFLYALGENLEILAYLYWPGLVLLGIAFNQSYRLQPISPSLCHET